MAKMRVRERPRTSANVRLRTVRLRTDADIRGLGVSAKVHESPLMSLGLPQTFNSPRQSANVHERPRKKLKSVRQTIADISGLSRTILNKKNLS